MTLIKRKVWTPVLLCAALLLVSGCAGGAPSAEVAGAPSSEVSAEVLSTAVSSTTAVSVASKAAEPIAELSPEASSAAERVSSEAETSSVAADNGKPVPSSGARYTANDFPMPSAPGTSVEKNGVASVDYSNTAQGYIAVKYTGSAAKTKLQITGPNKVTYTYNLKSGRQDFFPLTAGSGSYKVNVYEGVGGDQYAMGLATTVSANIASSTSPYLYPNQYVNYAPGGTTVKKGVELANASATDLELVQNVYNFVTKNITYDNAKASAPPVGYLPVVDSILASGKGICFDYAAVMATMLRSQGVPTRLEVGFTAGGIYHAWVTVYLKEVGWVNGVISFDGKTWKLMDPTFASNANGSAEIMQFIGNGSNYSTKYVY